jgi:hypothetical protein
MWFYSWLQNRKRRPQRERRRTQEAVAEGTETEAASLVAMVRRFCLHAG